MLNGNNVIGQKEQVRGIRSVYGESVKKRSCNFHYSGLKM